MQKKRPFQLFAVIGIVLGTVNGVSLRTSVHAQTPEKSVADLVRQTSASIVRIRVSGVVKTEKLVGDPPNQRIEEREEPGGGEGTGFVIDNNGHIVTNAHVVSGNWKDQPKIVIEMPAGKVKEPIWEPEPLWGKGAPVTIPASPNIDPDKRANPQDKDANWRDSYPAKIPRPRRLLVGLEHGQAFAYPILVGMDELSDLAVLKIPPKLLPPLRFANEKEIEVGQDVIAIGFALGLRGTPSVSKGILSADNRDTLEGRFGGLLQTDAVINHGNSGGPLLNRLGDVVGVNTYGEVGQALYKGPVADPVQGVFYARSCETAAPLVRILIQRGKVSRSWLGVEAIPAPRHTAVQLGLPDGAIISKIEPNSPAATASLRQFDVIIQLDDFEIRCVGDLNNALALLPPGEAHELVFQRYPMPTMRLKLERLEIQLGRRSELSFDAKKEIWSEYARQKTLGKDDVETKSVKVTLTPELGR